MPYSLWQSMRTALLKKIERTSRDAKYFYDDKERFRDALKEIAGTTTGKSTSGHFAIECKVCAGMKHAAEAALNA